jgi:bifunctional UDP-N-acetylglucosamine pyrophosphorylase/glucosamine-1-phosphate N-acetyltransferase
MKDLYALITAAGKGTRMVSNRAKVLHKVCGIPMLKMVWRAVAGVQPEKILVVIGQDADSVRACMDGSPSHFVLQEHQLGTGHAVMAASSELEQLGGDLLILCGDTPRIKTPTLEKLVAHHRRRGASATLLTVRTSNPFGYGRILRSAAGAISAIVEEKDATDEQRQITEINPGFYCFQITPLIAALGRLSNHNAQGEYYLTDLVEILSSQGQRVEAIEHQDFDELRGINTRLELAEVSLALGKEKNRSLMSSGVTFIDPDRTCVELDVVVEKDVTLYPAVTLEGNTHIGESSTIRTGTRIADSSIGPGVEVLDSCLITDSTVAARSTIGPFARLKEQTAIGERCRVGNFVEIKKCILGDGTKAAHLAYLGNAVIGRNVNIGAGVITCNYDGVAKYPTTIEDDVFVGTDSQLIAPVKIGRGAYIAAGSSITEDVPAGALAIARARQAIKENWVQRRKQKNGASQTRPK